MKRKTYLIVLPLLLLAIGLLTGCIRGVTGDSLTPGGEPAVTSDTHLGTDPHVIEGDHVTVDPRLPEVLEESEWAQLFFYLRDPPGFEFPSYELSQSDEVAYIEILRGMDMELYDQLRAERRADVLSVLGVDYQQLGNAGAQITASGLEKLRHHPYVRFVLLEEQDGTSDTHRYTDPHMIEGDHVTVDPRLLELLDESEWARVYIQIPFPPGFEWISGPFGDPSYIENVKTMDWDLYDRLRAERKAHVAAWLGADFEQRLPGQWITAAGVEKIRSHPFVTNVSRWFISLGSSFAVTEVSNEEMPVDD